VRVPISKRYSLVDVILLCLRHLFTESRGQFFFPIQFSKKDCPAQNPRIGINHLALANSLECSPQCFGSVTFWYGSGCGSGSISLTNGSGSAPKSSVTFRMPKKSIFSYFLMFYE
jgi:hypothetical protein